MALAFPPQSAGTNFEPVRSDNHIGVCIGVLDLGTHSESYQGGTPRDVHKVKIVFELPDELRSDGKTFTISKTFNLSMHEKSNFRQALESWLGKDETETIVGSSLEALLERPAMVNVEQGQDKDDPKRKYSYIDGLSKVPTRMTPPPPTRDTFFLDLDDKRLPAVLSLYDAEKIRQSVEYRAGGFQDDAPKPNDRQGNAANKPNGSGSGDKHPLHGAIKGAPVRDVVIDDPDDPFNQDVPY